MGEIQFELTGLPHKALLAPTTLTLTFPIRCPVGHVHGSMIIKCGLERKMPEEPQRYKCKTCRTRFYAHTSLFFYEVTQAVLALVFAEATQSRASLQDIATRYHLAPSVLCEFVNVVRAFLAKKVILLKTLLQQAPSNPLALTGVNKALYVDETFLRIRGTIYYLIVAVNSKGLPLGWKLAASRKGEVMQPFLEELFQRYGLPAMIVTDGNPTYRKVLLALRFEGLHVGHIHKGKRNRVVIRRYRFDEFPDQLIEEIVGLNHDAFQGRGTKQGWWYTQQRKLLKSDRPRGRPKGSKNRAKQSTFPQKDHPHGKGRQSGRSPQRKRGPKNVFRNGTLFEFRVDPDRLHLEVLTPRPAPENTTDGSRPDSTSLYGALYPLLVEFAGKYLSSNRIENLFSQFDLVFLLRGRRTEHTVAPAVDAWMLSHMATDAVQRVVHQQAKRFSPHIGLRNLGKIITPATMPIMTIKKLTRGDWR